MDFLPTLIAWGNRNPGIGALLLTGSRAGMGPVDHLSDYDLAVFCDDCRPFTESDEWLSQIAPPWICVHDSFLLGGETIPTRLSVFAGGIKVDFSFHPLPLLKRLATSLPLPASYDAGYRIVLDKGDHTAGLPPPTHQGYRLSPPDQAAFTVMEQEFWYEACEVAKFLDRGDLWPAKHGEQAMRKWLLLLLTWQQAARDGWNWAPKPNGKQMNTWLAEDLQRVIPQLFSGAGEEDTRRALRQAIELFLHLAMDTANRLGLRHGEEQARQVSEFLWWRLAD